VNTGGWLLFNGLMDRYLRALDADNGQLPLQTRLPSQIVGRTVTYSVNGRQYIAVAGGGGRRCYLRNERTVMRDWEFAKAWLSRELSK